MQKLAIISSVQPGIFSEIANNASFGFTDAERASALKDEKQVFLDAIWIPNLEEKVQIEVIRAMDGIPKEYSADAYILGGSPAMVTERNEKEWVDRLIRFIQGQIEKGTPIFGICFWHQVLATAAGWKVDWMQKRKIGKWKAITGKEDITSLWSHKQTVINPGAATIIGSWENLRNSPIQMIQIENATGMQFHPEFTPEFTAFLVKLMKKQIQEEWLNPDEILKELSLMQWNPSRVLLEQFVRKYYNI